MKINLNSLAALKKALDTCNGRATEHVLHPGDVVALGQELEARLEALGIPKKYRKGAIATAKSGTPVPNRYKYSRCGTWVKLERGPSGWFLVALNPATVYQDGGFLHLYITADQQDFAIAQLQSKYQYQVNA